MQEKMKTRILTADKFFLLFMLVSFLGWAGETIGCSIDMGELCDRGFINMPFCTIYGFTVLGLYALLGTPDGGGLLLKNMDRKPVRMVLYFVLGILITAAIELITGWFFTRICGISLWDYSAYRFNYKGYICLEFSILWGILILLGMKYVFGPICGIIAGLPEKFLYRTSGILGTLLLADWIVNYAKILLRGRF